MSLNEIPADISFDELVEGLRFSYQYSVTEKVYSGFISVFGDLSPIHTDHDYALSRGFEDKVMHGSILNGFLSHFIGMVCPGRRAMLLSVELSYHNPFFLNDRLELRAEVIQKVESQRVIVLKISFYNLTRGIIAAKGRAMVKLRYE